MRSARAGFRWLVLGAAFVLAACQAVGGFKSFETGPTSEGQACTSSSTCGGGVCVYGYCRAPCASDADCEKGSICLGDQSVGGCRLAGDLETKCQGTCANPNLACGLDGTCRTPCSATKSCPFNGEDCIQNACVSEGETDWQQIWGQCRDPHGETTCGDDGKTLTTCNVTRPGKAIVATCDSAALCQAAITSGGTACGAKVCDAGEFTCNGAVLQHCASDSTGYDMMTACASAALCIKGLSLNPPACAQPACGAGAADPTTARCMDGQLLTCSADQQGFDMMDCAPMQCDPGRKQCANLVIDAKEVTRAEYAAFVAASPAPADPPAGCTWKTSFAPDGSCMGSADVCNPAVSSCDAVPQVCVDWCDAYAYCQWTGRHLCGQLGSDAMVTLEQSNDPGQSAWMNACSSGGQFAWPEGNTWQASIEGQACNGSAKTAYTNGGAYPAGSLAQCHSPVSSYATIFDMSGNVSEWENSCSKDVKSANASKDDTCRVRGGSFKSGETSLRCDAHPQDLSRGAVASDVGFRCCG